MKRQRTILKATRRSKGPNSTRPHGRMRTPTLAPVLVWARDAEGQLLVNNEGFPYQTFAGWRLVKLSQPALGRGRIIEVEENDKKLPTWEPLVNEPKTNTPLLPKSDNTDVIDPNVSRQQRRFAQQTAAKEMRKEAMRLAEIAALNKLNSTSEDSNAAQ